MNKENFTIGKITEHKDGSADIEIFYDKVFEKDMKELLGVKKLTKKLMSKFFLNAFKGSFIQESIIEFKAGDIYNLAGDIINLIDGLYTEKEIKIVYKNAIKIIKLLNKTIDKQIDKLIPDIKTM